MQGDRILMHAVTDNSKVSVVIADDHTLLREALREILHGGGFRVVGEAHDGDSTVSLAARLRPDIVLLDIEMPCSRGSLTVQRLREVSRDSRVIVLSMHDDHELVSEVLRSGARAYLHKGVSKQELIWTLHNSMTDNQFVTVSVSRQSMTRQAPAPAPAGALSTREAEVLACVAAAMSNRQIAKRLGITEGTVKRHLSNVFAKLEAVSRIDAVNKAMADGILDRVPHQDAGGGPAAAGIPRTTRQPTFPSQPTAVTSPTPGAELPDCQRERRTAS